MGGVEMSQEIKTSVNSAVATAEILSDNEVHPQLGGKSGNIIRQQAADELVQQPVEELFQQAAEKTQSLILHQPGEEKGQQVADQIEVTEKSHQVGDQLEMPNTFGINPWGIISIFSPKTIGGMRYE